MKAQEVLKQIYLNPGIHLREIARRTNLGIPAVKHHLDRFLREKIITKRVEGRNLKFFIDFRERRIIPRLYEIETLRLQKLPSPVGNATADVLSVLESKPLITIVFGSYAKGDYTKKSDLDTLFVFNQVDKETEAKVKLVNSRYPIRIQPVYLSWKEFRQKFFDAKDAFMRELRDNHIIVNGVEYWVMLENEKA
jgi:predicted nucleotidyltransferase